MIAKPWNALFAAVFSTGLFLAAPALAQTTTSESGTMRTITVGGIGEVTATPDIATVEIGVETRAKSAAEAMRENTGQMSRLMAVLDTVGITGRDRRTASLQIMPDYNYRGSDDRSVLNGYVARNTLSVRVRELASIGDVLDALVAAGANQLNGIVFDVSEKAPLLDRARRTAVEDARRKATTLAESAGVALGEIVSIAEASSGGGPRPTMRSDVMMASEAVPVEAGEQTLQVQVTTVWSIAP